MQTIPLDTRTRILTRYDAGKHTRQDIADFFGVSLAFVKKIIAQRRKLGHARPLHDRVGRKRIVQGEREKRLAALVRKTPDATLEELRLALWQVCAVPTLWRALQRLGLTYKKNASRRRARPR